MAWMLKTLPTTDVVEAVVLKSQLKTTLCADSLLQHVARKVDSFAVNALAHLVEVVASLCALAKFCFCLSSEKEDIGIAEQTDVERNEVLAPLAWTLLVWDM